jgi:hydrogenase maturation protease
MTLDTDFTIDAPACCVIAYGNSQCGDDGIGPLVARKLRRHFEHSRDVGICSLPQLDPALLEEIQSADTLIFVDASMESLHSDVQWSRITPELNGWAMGSHHLDPEVFLGLLELLYNKIPSAWMVSVQGRAFGVGEPLSPEAHRSAEKAAVQIVDWLFKQNIALPYNKVEKED